MKLTKENVYIDLRGKTKEELTELKNILFKFKQNTFRGDLISYYYENQDKYNYFNFGNGTVWLADSLFELVKNKTEVTIEQLKEILQPMETLQEKEQRLLEELAEVRKEIEENNIKVLDWVKHNNNIVFKVEEDKYDLGVLNESKEFKKITNTEIINHLENLYNE